MKTKSDPTSSTQPPSAGGAGRAMSKTDTLLFRAFAFKSLKDGTWTPACGQVDTDQGTPSQWAYLDGCGYSEKATKSGRGMLGHRFSRRLTDKGRAYLQTLCDQRNTTLTPARPCAE